eukprot:TRINITY_DN125_c0_g1_i1.p1 TRINITY_DN125_c0_g1~~TRINITY_DN125_c0_g1_i1.p1  ORF type:complete len:208 (+),score=71.25 TRINITY_DN125_c0_g1_i1:44-625(+)
MSFTLPPLPFAQDALEPSISARTLSFHYGKHHAGYVTKLNAATEGTELASKSLEELIGSQSGKIFNLAAQVWNHTFYWNGLKAGGGGAPEGKLLELINRDFGSFDEFKAAFTTAAATHFGSGWAWLAQGADGKLQIVALSDAGNPLTTGLTPILTCDVWEHAYYLDQQNNRGAYIAAWWSLVNWDFAQSNLKA